MKYRAYYQNPARQPSIEGDLTQVMEFIRKDHASFSRVVIEPISVGAHQYDFTLMRSSFYEGIKALRKDLARLENDYYASLSAFERSL